MIKLDDNFTIEKDQYCWTLKYKNTKTNIDKDGESKEITSSWSTYHPTIQMALKKYCDSILKIAESIRDVIILLNKVHDKISILEINPKLFFEPDRNEKEDTL